MFKGRSMLSEAIGVFPLGRVARLVVSVVLAVAALTVSPVFGPAESFSNPALTLWYFFGIQATAIIGFLMLDHRSSSLALWQEQIVLGPLGVAAGSFLLFQTLPMEDNPWKSFFIGCAVGLFIAGVMNTFQAMSVMQKVLRKQVQAKRVQYQQLNEARQGAMDSMANLQKTIEEVRAEDALMADLAAFLDGPDQAGNRRKGA